MASQGQIAVITGLSPSWVHQLLGSEEARAIPRWLRQRRGQGLSDHPRPAADTGGRIGPIFSRPGASTGRRRPGGDRIEDRTDRVVTPRDPQQSWILPMKSTSRDGDFGASRTVLDHLRAADVALRREAREAVEAGNLETFTTLVAEYLRAPAPGLPGPRMAEELLDRVDWDWVAGAYLADPPGPVATGLPPVGLEG